MKRHILRLTVAILAFGLGVALDRVFISRQAHEVPQAERCDPSRIEVRTVFTPAPPPPPHQVFDFDMDSPPPTGYFYISGGNPKGFEDFDFLKLDWLPGIQEDQIKGDASIEPEVNGVYQNQKTLVAFVTERRVLVVTESKSNDGIGYRFDGKFVQGKDLEALAEAGKPILRGTLTKTKDGRKVVERVVSLCLEPYYYR